MPVVKARTLFFAGVEGLSLPFVDAPGLDIGGGILVTNDRGYTSRTIGAYVKDIGMVEKNFLVNYASGFASARGDSDFDFQDSQSKANGILIQYLAFMQSWMLALWLQKDNAVNFETGWLVIFDQKNQIANNNNWTTRVSKADGTFANTKYQREDILAINLKEIAFEEKYDGSPIEMGMNNRMLEHRTKLRKQSSRFQRFSYFIGAARSTPDIALKVANYCSGLEAMVSNSQTELSHQVSERTACALHPRGEARLETFQLVRKAYGVRSKAVHGATFKDNEKEGLVRISLAIDDVCRNLAINYMDNKDFEELIESSAERASDLWMKKIIL